MGSFERETAAFAKIIAERAPKPREPRAPSSWLCEDRAGASHFRDVDGCEDVDSFLASGFARYLSLSAVSRFEGRVCDARSHGYKPQGRNLSTRTRQWVHEFSVGAPPRSLGSQRTGIVNVNVE